mmetsp:Transcript_61063/g.176911  ORF Transcript_61063/g.176911 Transcript_61063/m.176911 type:complete len:619 (-) Transcript_61063:139-1995(-)
MDWDAAVSWCTALVLLAQVPIVIRWLRHAARPELSRRVVAWVARVGRGLWRCFGGGSVEPINSEVAELVMQRLGEIRVECALYMFRISWAVGLLRLMQLVLKVTLGLQTSPRHGPEWLIAQAALQIVSTLVVTFPQVLNQQTLPLFHWIIMGVLCFEASPLSTITSEDLMLLRPLLLILTLCCSAIFFRVRVNLFSNILFSACLIAGHGAKVPLDSGLSTLDLAQLEFNVLFWKLALLYLCESLMKASITREVEAKLGRCQLSAVLALLNMMCDAVVDLDSNLTFKDHPAKFAGMLMNTSPRSLQGESLAQCIFASEDRKRFQELVAAARDREDGRPAPSMLTVHLRDSIGNAVKVDLFHVPYWHVNGALEHLIGFREDNFDVRDPHNTDSLGAISRDTLPSMLPAAQPEHAMPPAVLRPEVASLLGAAAAAGPAPTSEDGDAVDAADASGAAIGANGSSDTDSVPGELVADVLVTAGLPIHAASNGLRRQIGVSDCIGHSFGQYIDDGGQDFIDWLMRTAEAVRSGSGAPRILRYGALTVGKPATAAGASNQVAHQVRVFYPSPPAADDADYVVSIKLSAFGRSAFPACVGRGTMPTCSPQALTGPASPARAPRIAL